MKKTWILFCPNMNVLLFCANGSVGAAACDYTAQHLCFTPPVRVFMSKQVEKYLYNDTFVQNATYTFIFYLVPPLPFWFVSKDTASKWQTVDLPACTSVDWSHIHLKSLLQLKFFSCPPALRSHRWPAAGRHVEPLWSNRLHPRLRYRLHDQRCLLHMPAVHHHLCSFLRRAVLRFYSSKQKKFILTFMRGRICF